jgi:DNA-binding IclR family transcriptional regulator
MESMEILPHTILKPLVTSEGPYQLQSIDRAVAVLDLLGESEVPLNLAEICRRMPLCKSTAHRSLMVLERALLIERTPDNRFCLGMKLYDLGNRAVEQMDLRTRAAPAFRQLSQQLRETLHLGVLQKTSVVYLEKAHGSQKICSGSKTGSSNPAYCTAMGKAMLAFLPPDATNYLIESMRFVRFTPKTLCTREDLMKSLERVRRRGYGIDDEEIELGVRCIAAPIFDENHMPIAAISVSGPSSRIQVQSVPMIAAQLLRSCKEISASLRSRHKKRAQVAAAIMAQREA